MMTSKLLASNGLKTRINIDIHRVQQMNNHCISLHYISARATRTTMDKFEMLTTQSNLLFLMSIGDYHHQFHDQTNCVYRSLKIKRIVLVTNHKLPINFKKNSVQSHTTSSKHKTLHFVLYPDKINAPNNTRES
eukprot:240944_1